MIAAVSMCKDEADIVASTVTRMLGQVDRVIVADNGSTDGTRDLLADLEAEHPELTVLDDEDPAYYQSAKITRLAHIAEGAEWIVPFDADEVWVGRRGTVAATLCPLPEDIYVAEAVLYDHVATGLDPQASPLEAIQYRRQEPAPLKKVAFRPIGDFTVDQGNHGVTYAEGPGPVLSGALAVHHFPYRSAEQMIRKARNGAAAYAATDLPEQVGAHWRQYGRLSDEQLDEVFHEYFWSADAADLVHDPV